MKTDESPFDRKMQGDWINQKLKELQDFCNRCGIDCQLSFGGGFECRSKFVVGEDGEWRTEQIGTTRSFTSIGLKITLTDSDKGDDVRFIPDVIKMLLNNIGERKYEDIKKIDSPDKL